MSIDRYKYYQTKEILNKLDKELDLDYLKKQKLELERNPGKADSILHKLNFENLKNKETDLARESIKKEMKELFDKILNTISDESDKKSDLYKIVTNNFNNIVEGEDRERTKRLLNEIILFGFQYKQNKIKTKQALNELHKRISKI